MSTTSRTFCLPLLAAGFFGFTGVALGALGAHALKITLLQRGTMTAWETGSRYHLFHALALLGIAAWVETAPTGGGARLMHWATRCWCVGIVLFSVSLYWLALGGPRWLGPVTPLGGVALMAGWALIGIAAFKHDATPVVGA